MDLINSWRSKTKAWDKFAIKVRLGRLTILDIYGDGSRKQFGISIFNFGVKTQNDKNVRQGNIEKKAYPGRGKKI